MSNGTMHQINNPTMNVHSTPRTDGDGDSVTNKRKRFGDGYYVDALGEQFGHVELLSEVANNNNEQLGGDANGVASLSSMPDSMLLHIFSFVLGRDKAFIQEPRIDSLTTQLALEKTCHKFSALLVKDSTMRLFYQPREEDLEFDHRVENLREKLFIANGVRLIRRFQKSTDTLICEYMGGSNGVRRIIDSMLINLEQPCDQILRCRILRPPQFPENGFKLFLRGDSIAYLTEVIEQHMVYRLNSAMSAALFRSNPPSSHPYPMVCKDDILFVDSIRTSDFGALDSCVVCRASHSCSRLSLSESPKIWKWPDNNCMDEETIEADRLHSMVRAIASRAGIVKLTGGAFDSIAAEILHFMATIVIDAFEVSKSLWCPDANVERNVVVDDEIMGEESDGDASFSSDICLEFNHFANHDTPPPETLDEKGRHVCVVIPRQIRDAAVRLGMKPLLFGQSWDKGCFPMWEVSEGRTLKEELDKDVSLYGLSSDDESASLEVGSDSESEYEPNDGEVAAINNMMEELWNNF